MAASPGDEQDFEFLLENTVKLVNHDGTILSYDGVYELMEMNNLAKRLEGQKH